MIVYSNSFFIRKTYRKFIGNLEEKKVGVAGLQPTLYLLEINISAAR